MIGSPPPPDCTRPFLDVQLVPSSPHLPVKVRAGRTALAQSLHGCARGYLHLRVGRQRLRAVWLGTCSAGGREGQLPPAACRPGYVRAGPSSPPDRAQVLIEYSHWFDTVGGAPAATIA